jgi:hypothetical protein
LTLTRRGFVRIGARSQRSLQFSIPMADTTDELKRDAITFFCPSDVEPEELMVAGIAKPRRH